jgi:hypothetical protein
MIRTTLLCAAALSLVLSAPAQAGDDLVFPTISLVPASVGRTLDVGDMNEDGLTDIITTALSGIDAEDVVVMLADGFGNYDPEPAFVVGHIIRRLRMADLDADGHLDMILAVDGVGLEVVAVHFGVGDGSFSGSSFIALSAGPNDLDVADLDGDGDLDLVIPMLFSSRVSVALNNGNGNFGTATEFLAGTTPRLSAVGDVDGDGTLDLAVANNSTGAVSVLLGDGLGSFGSPSTLAVGGSPDDVEFGDVNGDGDLDLAVGHAGLGEVTVLLGNGDGSFGSTKSVPFPGATVSLEAVDVDEDGFADLVAMAGGTSSAVVRLSLGDGSFGPPDQHVLFGSQDLRVVDVTSDGDVDLVGNGQVFFLSSAVAVREGRGDGSFGHFHKGTDGCSDVQFDDLDNDGIDDMVLVNEFAHDLTVYPGTGNGFFGGGVNHAVGDDPNAVAIADYDGDGNLDLALAQETFAPGTISILFGDGAFGFTAPVAIGVGSNLRTLKSDDVDLDGDADLLVTSRNDNTFLVLRNDGSGSFGPPDVYATTDFPYDLKLGDLNGDGLTDAAVSTEIGVAHVYLAIGGGAFNGPLSFAVGTAGDGLALGDVDGDGDLDLAMTEPGGVNVAYNTGAGLFTGATLFATGGFNSDGVVIADFDRDGLADLAVSNGSAGSEPGGDAVAFLKGDGTGSFALGVESLVSNLPRRLTGHDLNGDGALDLAAPGFGDSVALLINRRGPWTQLGNALAGVKGLPRQTGEGTLVAGEPFLFTLTDARPNAITAHILGLTAVNAKFKGGVFVPTPDLINTPLNTDADGTATVAGNWFPGLSGFSFWLQFWHADPAGVKNFAASTALRADVP